RGEVGETDARKRMGEPGGGNFLASSQALASCARKPLGESGWESVTCSPPDHQFARTAAASGSRLPPSAIAVFPGPQPREEPLPRRHPQPRALDVLEMEHRFPAFAVLAIARGIVGDLEHLIQEDIRALFHGAAILLGKVRVARQPAQHRRAIGNVPGLAHGAQTFAARDAVANLGGQRGAVNAGPPSRPLRSSLYLGFAGRHRLLYLLSHPHPDRQKTKRQKQNVKKKPARPWLHGRSNARIVS